MKKVVLTLIVACLIITCGVMVGKLLSSNSAGGSCDWRMYENTDQLINASNIVIKGSIVKIYPSQDIVIGEAVNSETGEKKAIKSLYTIADVMVLRVYKGDIKEGEIIKVKQWGGIDKDKHFGVSGVEYYKVNELRYFFLETYDDGTPASPLNCYQGDLKVENGKIISRDPNMIFSEVNSESDMDAKIDSTVKRIEKVTAE